VCRAAPLAIHPLVWTNTQLHLLAAWGGSGAPLICFIFWRFSHALLVVFVWKWISWWATELEDIPYTELITDSENAGTDGRFNRNRSDQEKQNLHPVATCQFALPRVVRTVKMDTLCTNIILSPLVLSNCPNDLVAGSLRSNLRTAIHGWKSECLLSFFVITIVYEWTDRLIRSWPCAFCIVNLT
jgi:hypothetical protein